MYAMVPNEPQTCCDKYLFIDVLLAHIIRPMPSEVGESAYDP